MSQVATKTSPVVSGLKTDKPNSRSSTPANPLAKDDEKRAKASTPVSKSNRRVSNDSQKVGASPKPLVVLEDTQKKNGHQEETQVSNGNNGIHTEANGNNKNVEEKPETPKNNKNEKDVKQDAAAKKAEKSKTQNVDSVKTPKSAEKKQPEVLSEKTQSEMETLIIEPEAHADSPMPKSIGKSPGRILKLSQGPPPRGARISPFKKASERLQNASTIVNLSTVSEQSVESTSTTASPGISNDSPIIIQQGRISGRRTTRPIKDIKLIHTRFSNSDSSINATVGSPIHNDSLRTPVIAQMIARKRKDESPEYEDFHNESPSKRLRIDFSGFLGYVRTPVTLLRNRFSRVGLQSSTPRALDTEEHIADVSGMESEEVKSDVSQAIEATESVNEKEVQDIKSENIEKTADSEDTDIEVTETRRRSVCSIM